MIKRLIIVFIAFSQVSHADEVVDCYETAMTQSAMNACARSDYQETSNTLDELLIELKETLPDEPEKYLDLSQEAWNTVVKNDCEIESWYMGDGTARSLIASDCYSSHTVKRIQMLAPMLCSPMQSTCEKMKKYKKYFSNPKSVLILH